MFSLMCVGQTIEEVKAEIVKQKLPHPNIVLAQARLETGNFKFHKNHNIFGIKHDGKYAKYKHWRLCIADYKKYISSKYTGGDYYAFLMKIKYAKDKQYIEKLKKFK